MVFWLLCRIYYLARITIDNIKYYMLLILNVIGLRVLILILSISYLGYRQLIEFFAASTIDDNPSLMIDFRMS